MGETCGVGVPAWSLKLDRFFFFKEMSKYKLVNNNNNNNNNSNNNNNFGVTCHVFTLRRRSAHD